LKKWESGKIIPKPPWNHGLNGVRNGKDIFVHFDYDQGVNAAINAKKLLEIVVL
jgi:hypothetical protein